MFSVSFHTTKLSEVAYSLLLLDKTSICLARHQMCFFIVNKVIFMN